MCGITFFGKPVSASEGAIGLELRMPKSTVHSIIVKYRLSNTVENLPRNGRPKKP
uniref:Uncharacterized protein n=1 Tax=Scophthalmus maximus TaxID=52904 RepID=A0A8D3A0R1_SCOMX